MPAYDVCSTCGSQKTGFTTLFCPRCETRATAQPVAKAWYVCFWGNDDPETDHREHWNLSDAVFVRRHFDQVQAHLAHGPFVNFTPSDSADQARATCGFGPVLISLDDVVD